MAKKTFKKILPDTIGKNVVYGWLRNEAGLSKTEVCNRIELTYYSLDRAFNEPHKYLTDFQIERIAYCLPNRTFKEIRLALTEDNSLSASWYEQIPNEEEV
jgi:hypothetical protein